MLLSELKDGAAAGIIAVNMPRNLKERFYTMGFTEGERVECIARAAFGSPLLFRVKGSEIAVRKRDAKRIEVRA